MLELPYHQVSCFNEKPNAMIKFLIVRNLNKLIQCNINAATQFIHTSQSKIKALQNLKYTILIAQQCITIHSQLIIKSLVRIIQLQIEDSIVIIHEIVQILGWNVNSSIWIPILLNILTQEQFHNSIKNTIILLDLLNYMLKGTNQLSQHSSVLIEMLDKYQIILQENNQALLILLNISSILLERLNEFNQKEINILFTTLLTIQSTKTILQSKRQQSYSLIDKLSKKTKYQNIYNLHENLIQPILQQIITTKSYIKWNKTNKQRFKFDTIVRNCSIIIIKFIQPILQILQSQLHPQIDIENRMDSLVLIEYLLKINELKQQLHKYSQTLIRNVLLLSIRWKVGKPQIKIRKAGIINIILLITQNIIDCDQLLFCFNDLLPHLKTCLNDDWGPELRLITCQLLQKLLMLTKDRISDDQLRQIYPLLLERLDDSKNEIRKKITIGINVFFLCPYLKLSSSIIQYMITAIIVHYDDNQQEIRDSINICLRRAVKINAELVYKITKLNIKKMKHFQQCKQLISYCQEIIQENKL